MLKSAHLKDLEPNDFGKVCKLYEESVDSVFLTWTEQKLLDITPLG